MKIDKNGKIAYHVIRFREDSGSEFVQYNFDGSVEYIEPFRRYNLSLIMKNDP